ncbi:tyrosine-protein phosphatase [Zhihengliuella sp.]|uniref:tyrosine-protein phosphatase n=1 Tax=Zhihengliuella sp. TaxID=1954483 RepID=UPI002810E269|nr:tyrosine-protein phosphatase [Zhihengliuella sp.]
MERHQQRNAIGTGAAPAEPDAHSSLSWEGAVNAHHVAGGLYRMGRSEWLTPAGWQQMQDDGVRTVLDLRNPGERSRRPTDPELPEGWEPRIAVVNCPTEDQTNAEFMAQVGAYLSDPAYYAANVRLFPDRIADVFRHVGAAAERGAVVIHCSAGRDRTGLIVSLALQLAGRTDLIEEQYAVALRGINAWHAVSSVKHPYESHLEPAELARILDAKLGRLREFLDAMDVEALLRRPGGDPAAGLGDAEIEAVRRLLG